MVSLGGVGHNLGETGSDSTNESFCVWKAI